MNYLIDFYKQNKTLAILILFLFLGIILITFFILLQSTKKEVKKADQLTKTEKNYPEAPAQPFLPNSKDVGSLVITSNTKDIRIMIDSPEEEVATKSANLPINTNPFKISSIPVGHHTVVAFKTGYELYESSFTIEKGQITRLDINLLPFGKSTSNDPRGWIGKLPIQAQYYYIEYDTNRSSVVATLNPPPAVQTTKDKQIDFLKKLVLNDLKQIGVNTDQEKIVWIIK